MKSKELLRAVLEDNYNLVNDHHIDPALRDKIEKHLLRLSTHNDGASFNEADLGVLVSSDTDDRPGRCCPNCGGYRYWVRPVKDDRPKRECDNCKTLY